MDLIKNPCVCIINVGKTYSWTFENKEERVSFIYGIIQMLGNDDKKLPKFVNFDAELILEQMAAIDLAAEAAKQGKTTSQDLDEVHESEDEFNDGFHF